MVVVDNATARAVLPAYLRSAVDEPPQANSGIGHHTGVGFRPRVLRLANCYQLSGRVKYSVRCCGRSTGQRRTCSTAGPDLKNEAPPLAGITSLVVTDQNCKVEDGFRICTPERGSIQTH
jgi:hydrogenase maturation factor HypF (carbamoyltransferase family)